MFEKLHNWLYFKYGISVTQKTMVLVILLLCSIVFLIGSLMYNGTFNRPATIVKPAAMPLPAAGQGA